MKWIAIMLMFASTSIVECGNIHFETCPKDGPATIEVVHDSYVKISDKLVCPFVIKPKSTLFVKVEIEDIYVTKPHYISFFNGDTSKLCEYNKNEMFKYIISTNLEIRKANIHATLKITPLPSTTINGNQTLSSEIVFIPYQTISKSTLDLKHFLSDFVQPNRKTSTRPTLPTTKMTTPITKSTTISTTSTAITLTTRAKPPTDLNNIRNISQVRIVPTGKLSSGPISTTKATFTTTTLCTRESTFNLTSVGTIQKPNDNWCRSCKIVPYSVENDITIALSGKLKCSLLFQPMHADEIKVEVLATRRAPKKIGSISIWTCNMNDEEFHLRSTQQSLMYTEALPIVAAQVRIEDIELDAILKITTIFRLEKYRKVGPLKSKFTPTIQPKEAIPLQEDASTQNIMIIQIVILIVLGVIGIFLSACILRAIQKSKNQVVCVVSLSNLRNNDTQAQANSNSEPFPEGSTSIHQEVTNIPSVPRSLPSYSECDFDQDSTCQEPPSYEEALKLNWV